MASSDLILAFDTATPVTTVALTRGTPADGEVLAELSLAGGVAHSRRLLQSAQRLLAEVEVSWADLAAIGVGLGPGSFTGLRIGMATAKGIAAARGLPLLGVSTLDVLAAAVTCQGPVCSVIDARKKEVYCASYAMDEQGLARRKDAIRAMAPLDLAAELCEKTLLIGDGARVYRELFAKAPVAPVFAGSATAKPRAALLGLLCKEELLAGRELDLDCAEPCYVRSSDAELNLAKKKEAQARIEAARQNAGQGCDD